MSSQGGRDGELTHVDEAGKVTMVDVGGKEITSRRAVARGQVLMAEETLAMIVDRSLKKGEVLAVARVAGIMAAKKTADLIPLCHPLSLSRVSLELTPRPGEGRIEITAEAACEGRTGVEMEALTAVTVAALTIYDMAKAVDRGMTISGVELVEKSGGRSGTWKR